MHFISIFAAWALASPCGASGVANLESTSVDLSDIAFGLNPATSDPKHPGQLQCMGQVRPLSAVTSPLLAGNGSGGTELKHGWTLDSADPARRVNYFAIRETDPDTAGPGNKRCEYAFAGDGLWIPWNKEFWFAVAIKTSSLAGTTDQQTVWQWHEGSQTVGLSPFLAAVLAGDRLSIQARHNSHSAFSQSNTGVVSLYKSDNWQPYVWHRFVVQARLDSADNSRSYLRLWLNEKQVVDYTGPLGYLYPSQRDYVKVGLYHWTNAGNTWQAAAAKREAWVMGPVLLTHRAGHTHRAVANLIR